MTRRILWGFVAIVLSILLLPFARWLGAIVLSLALLLGAYGLIVCVVVAVKRWGPTIVGWLEGGGV